MSSVSQTRRIATALLLVAVAATAWLLTHEAFVTLVSSNRNIALNPGYQHAQRLEIATTRSAMDVLGMAGQDDVPGYRSDYRLQRMQIQADSLGLERWGAHDIRRQGLLLEIRASLAELVASMDQATGNDATRSGAVNAARTIPLPQALTRAQTALTDYSASLTEPMRQAAQGRRYLFTMPFALWWLLVLVLVELAVLAWLVLARKQTGRATV